jgi:hypothetical protein
MPFFVVFNGFLQEFLAGPQRIRVQGVVAVRFRAGRGIGKPLGSWLISLHALKHCK